MATSFSEIKSVLGSPPGVTRDSINLSDYYNTSDKAGYWITGIPSSGPIAISNLAGKTPAIEWEDTVAHGNNTRILFDGIELENKGIGATSTTMVNDGATLNVTVGGFPATRIGSTNAATLGALVRTIDEINSTGIFTIECKLYINTIRNEDLFVGSGGDFSSPSSYYYAIRTYNDKLELIFRGQRSIINISDTLSQLRNRWLTLAWCRDSDNYVRAFFNGQMVSNTQLSGQIKGIPHMGRYSAVNTPNLTCDAYIRQFRYTNNVRYITNYNPYEFLAGSLIP